MSGSQAATLSIVAPVFNEEENAEPLVEGIAEAARPIGRPFEIVIVDDGSSDATFQRLAALRERVPELVLIGLRRNYGQTLALQAGLDRACGDAIVTMDGDLQKRPPRHRRACWRPSSEGADVVSAAGASDRKDGLVLRKVPSWIANRLIRVVTAHAPSTTRAAR